mmetsp:Transcript_36546/g.85912  ORF Transcript_36546/g.85912 Transcript_36546/m.85912 type:complete len:261 (-) Transcript_36546:10-792(-)
MNSHVSNTLLSGVTTLWSGDEERLDDVREAELGALGTSVRSELLVVEERLLLRRRLALRGKGVRVALEGVLPEGLLASDRRLGAGLLHVQELHAEEERRVRGDLGVALFAVGERRGNVEHAEAAGLHVHQTLVPALDDLVPAEGEGDGALVELLAVGELARVLHLNNVANLGLHSLALLDVRDLEAVGHELREHLVPHLARQSLVQVVLDSKTVGLLLPLHEKLGSVIMRMEDDKREGAERQRGGRSGGGIVLASQHLLL